MPKTAQVEIKVTDLDELKGLLDYLQELIRVGDHMQSEASRLAEWVKDNVPYEHLPYEVAGALHGVIGAIIDWTDARRSASSREQSS